MNFCIFALNPPFRIRGSFTDSCGVYILNAFIHMQVDNNGFGHCINEETNALIERDENVFIWVYKGKEQNL